MGLFGQITEDAASVALRTTGGASATSAGHLPLRGTELAFEACSRGCGRGQFRPRPLVLGQPVLLMLATRRAVIFTKFTCFPGRPSN